MRTEDQRATSSAAAASGATSASPASAATFSAPALVPTSTDGADHVLAIRGRSSVSAPAS
ncbi:MULTISPECIES: hypothetical protein [unclassified Pseudonocardia]|uniref:hypothetical protein n=1 Tax=unclassified Pseudonocardia TaxID=2619320 RepID=UPI001E2C38E8|nr:MULTISPECIES: hypothetical protein [unclassified Pseudonocardia]